MSNYTLDQLAKLKGAYARGVTRVREGETWVEYGSLKELRMVIADIEAELNIQRQNRPRGVRRIGFGRVK